MSKVIHTIKGIRYWYEHTRINGRVVCKYLGPVDGNKQRTSSPRLSDATRTKNSAGQTIYTSQEDLDNEVRNAYTRGGLGIKSIQTNIFGHIGLSPSRREVENYLQNDLGVTLRKRPRVTSQPESDASSELAQAKEDLAVASDERDSKSVRIAEMHQTLTDDTKEILRLKEKLMDFRDMGRAPTDAEIEELVG